MRKYGVIANDDAMKYQVIDTRTSKAKYENDAESEAIEICDLLNEVFDEGRKEMLDFISS